MEEKVLMQITDVIFKCKCGKITTVPINELVISGFEDGDVTIDSESKCECGMYFSEYIPV
jgi:hypothetical protein